MCKQIRRQHIVLVAPRTAVSIRRSDPVIIRTRRQPTTIVSSGINNSENLSNQLKEQQGNARKMNITKEDKTALIAFLHSLSDYSLLNDSKLSSPFYQ